MNLVFLGLVVIAINLYGSDSLDSSLLGCDNNNGHIEKKRKALVDPSETPKELNNAGKNIVGLSESLKSTYACNRCKISVIKSFKAVTHHMHTINEPCFPKEGIACLDCAQPSEKLYKAVEMLEHNQKNHAQLSKWQCRFCGASSYKNKWINHLAYYTKISEAAEIFDGWTDGDLKVFKNSKLLSQIIRINSSQSLPNDIHNIDQEDVAVMVLNNLGNNK